MTKKGRYFLGFIIIFAIVSLFFNFYLYGKVTETPSSLTGTFQTEDTNPSGLLMMSFTQEGDFEEYYESELMDSGTYEQKKENVYVLHSDKKDEMITLQKNQEEQFYYYSDDGNVYLLEKEGNAPTKISTEEN